MFKIVEKIQKLDVLSLLKNVMDFQFIKDKIVELNKEQLNEFGVDKNNASLETYLKANGYPYAFSTVQIKKDKGQPYDKVTLKDTGAFQNTFSVETEDTFSRIDANFNKGSDNISKNLDTTSVLGLTDENKSELIQYIRPIFISELKKQLDV
jgi:hypothetical protein